LIILTTNNSESISNIFNKFFLSVADTVIDPIKTDKIEIVSSTNPLKYLDHNFEYPFPKIKWHHTSTNEINRIIKCFEPKNSAGYNGIPPKMLKITASFLISPLIYTCNNALSLGCFPERLKYSIVQPMFMKGDRSVISNYRPISLQTSFSKIFGKLIYARLYDHLKQHNVFTPEQHGFRAKSSMEKASYNLLHAILLAMNSKNTVGGIFCDLQKALDCVTHNILLEK
jgi:hypothetical protein